MQRNVEKLLQEYNSRYTDTDYFTKDEAIQLIRRNYINGAPIVADYIGLADDALKVGFIMGWHAARSKSRKKQNREAER